MSHGSRRRKSFWGAWQEEQQRRWKGQHWEANHSASEMAHAWREFFRSYMGVWPENHWAFSGRRFKAWHQGLDSFNPFVTGLLSKGGGLLSLYVLYLLSQQPRYGNEIMALISERTGGQWLANPGAIYPLMTGLENHGLIEGQWQDPRKRTVRIYTLTEIGEQEFVRLKTIVQPKLNQAIEVLQKLAHDLNGDEGGGEKFV